MAGNLTAMIASIFSGGVTADPYYEYTTLLLPGNGTNGAQNNTFLDGSTNNFTITRNGNTTQGTFSPFSQTGWGGYFDGNGDYLTLSNSSNFSCSGNFTVDFFIYPTSFSNTPVIFDTRTSSGSSAAIYAYINTSGNIVAVVGGTSITSSSTYAANSWYYVAIVRSSNVVTLYVNATSAGTATVSTNLTDTGMTIGAPIDQRGATTTNKVTGYISNFRFNNTTARTISSTPTTALTADSGTTLLTLQSNRFIDNASSATVTPNGGISVVAFSPFNPTASWSAATYGGSGYFDGNLDYLTAPNNAALAIGSGQFCIEFWIYPTSSWPTDSPIFVSAGTGGLWVGVFGGSFVLRAYGVANLLTYGTLPTLNTWTHIAICRDNSNVTSMYFNGSRVATGTVTQNFAQFTPYIGSDGGAAYIVQSYFSNLRLVKGSAVYDPTLTTCTVPTAPLTAITNTSLLLNFTNAGIYDATSKNDLETVGNASISNTTAQFGTTSITFNGTTGYMTAPASSLFNFGTGDFTIEAWIYASSLATRVIFSNSSGSGTNNITFYITTNGKLNANNFGVAAISSTGSITAGTWNYVAITKASGTYTFYINGSSSGSFGSLGSSNNLTDGYCTVGARPGPSDLWSGYIQDLRITKGVARTITASPTAAFPTL